MRRVLVGLAALAGAIGFGVFVAIVLPHLITVALGR